MLHVQDGNMVIQQNADNAFSGEFQFTKSRHATDGSHTVVQDGDILGEISFKGSDGDEFVTAAAITAAVGGTPGDNDMPGKLTFQTTADGATSLTTAMTIHSDQCVELADCIVVKGVYNDTVGTDQFAAIDWLDAGVNTGGRVITTGTSSAIGTFAIRSRKASLVDPGGVNVLLIATNQNATFSGTVTQNSDSKLKTDVRDLDSMLSTIKSLRPVKFKRISQLSNDDHTTSDYYGFIAQEAQSHIPDLVHSHEDTNLDGTVTGEKTLSFSYTEMIPILTKVIQEQQEKIESLEARLSALESS